jgi:uncharacterized protein YkwD
MQPGTRRPVVMLLLGLAMVLLSLAHMVAGVGTTSPLPLELTPTAYAYLPLVARNPHPTAIPPDDLDMEQAVADEINQRRYAHGLASVRLVPELTQAARRHCRDMADNHFTGHTGSDGSSAGERMEEAGYDWTTWGEIIAWGSGASASQVVDLWMSSPGHRAIILSSSYEDFGVGYVSDPASDWGHYWAVDFGKRAPELDFIHFDLTDEQDKLWHLPTKEDGQCLPCPENILP